MPKCLFNCLSYGNFKSYVLARIYLIFKFFSYNFQFSVTELVLGKLVLAPPMHGAFFYKKNLTPGSFTPLLPKPMERSQLLGSVLGGAQRQWSVHVLFTDPVYKLPKQSAHRGWTHAHTNTHTVCAPSVKESDSGKRPRTSHQPDLHNLSSARLWQLKGRFS